MDWTEKALKHVVFGALFVVPFIVFVVDSSQVFPFITGKNFLFRVLVGTSFFAWLGLIFFREEYRPKKSLLLLSVSILVAVMFLAGLFGIEPKQSFWSNFEAHCTQKNYGKNSGILRLLQVLELGFLRWLNF